MHLVTTSVRKAKLMDAKEAAENAAADKQARSVEADTFRGVHLDPNAHHWDEVGLLTVYSHSILKLRKYALTDGRRR
jgi:hypothetical protein